MTNFEYIRSYYGVPAKRGARIRYRGKNLGTITSTQAAGLRIRMDGEKYSDGPYHPTWEMEYLDAEKDKGEQ